MSFEIRPSTNEAFYERLRNAEMKKQEEIDNVTRKPRVSDKRKARCMREIEMRRESLQIEMQHKEVLE